MLATAKVAMVQLMAGIALFSWRGNRVIVPLPKRSLQKFPTQAGKHQDFVMLEHERLILGPWESAPGSSKRAILDGQTQRPLGLVRSRSGSRPAWLRWTSRPVWEILEAPDESLLMTLHGSWMWQRSWEVYDAEPRLVGTLRGGRIFNHDDRPWAELRPHPERSAGRFVSAQGLELASFHWDAQGTLLAFQPLLEGDPFAKMLVLAATISLP
jgi:hypothetical protein